MKNDGERLASMEAQMDNVIQKVNSVENAVHSLDGKIDSFMTLVSEKYMATATFDQYKETVKEQKKNDTLQKLLLTIVTAVITGLIAFYFK
jgi:hypothetical protein